VLVAGALALAPLGSGREHRWLLLGLGGAGVLALCVGLVARWSAALAFGVAVIGAEHAVRLTTGADRVDPWTPLYGAGFLLAAELAWWSIEPRVPAWAEYGTTARRLGVVVAACAGGTVLSALVVLAAGAPLHGGLGLELVGVAAATAALALVAAVARSRVG
jgi:hypothetical protein